MSNYHYFDLPKGKLSYLKFGKGKRLLIALHGFSDQAILFKALEESLSPHYTVYAIDFPFHGNTVWNAAYFESADVLLFIERILQDFDTKRFDLMAYSMGGRIALKILPELMGQLNHLYIIAPDGIGTKWMFDVTRLPFFTRRLLQRTLQQPQWFFTVLSFLKKRKILTTFLHDFAYNHIKTPERRKRIFGTWASIQRFQFAAKDRKALLVNHQLPTDVYFGIRDEVIPIRIGEWLSEGVATIRLHRLEEGHLLVDQQLNALLKEQLNEMSSK